MRHALGERRGGVVDVRAVSASENVSTGRCDVCTSVTVEGSGQAIADPTILRVAAAEELLRELLVRHVGRRLQETGETLSGECGKSPVLMI